MSGGIAKRTRSQFQLPDEEEEEEDYHPYTPLIKEVVYSDGTQCDYHPMKISEDERHSAKFAMPLNVEPTINSIQEMFLPHQFITAIVKNSNLYGKSKGQSFVNITETDVLRFIAIVLYFGVVSLPSKEDYWNETGLWPKHLPCQQMPYTRFKNVWANLHLTKPEEGNHNDNENDNIDDNDDDETSNNDNQPHDTRWYSKAAPCTFVPFTLTFITRRMTTPAMAAAW